MPEKKQEDKGGRQSLKLVNISKIIKKGVNVIECKKEENN